MPVIDVTGRLVGSVKYVKHGAPAAVAGPADPDEDLDTAFARALTEREPQIDRELAEDLISQGFLKVTGAGAMDNDLYLLAGQIAVADEDAVRLSSSVDELAVERGNWI
ncbi:hypothetical protein OHA18_41195 [Kribbella sp. NBC_00709]|uniref:hypothetical protein n=1 Tax=Kribbella sp. NBC_00709 TaxID=2975972 RepID=UPI002E2CECCD|nr:hypothetical protein [Kribbella sp. NBC_00709]